MKTKNKALGDLGEEKAAKRLQEQGLKIIARNWRCRFGELDIVAGKVRGILNPKLKEIVFVEVKSGFANAEVGPEKNIRQNKKQKMQRAIQVFLSQNKKKIPENTIVKALALVIIFNKDYKLEEIKEYSILF